MLYFAEMVVLNSVYKVHMFLLNMAFISFVKCKISIFMASPLMKYKIFHYTNEIKAILNKNIWLSSIYRHAKKCAEGCRGPALNPRCLNTI